MAQKTNADGLLRLGEIILESNEASHRTPRTRKHKRSTMLQQVITRNRSCVLLAAIVGFVVSFYGEARGDMIFVANSSFEGPSFVSGAFGAADNWGSSGSGGAYRPGLIVADVPDGDQVGFAGNIAIAGSLFQNLGVSVIPGATYNLDLLVGSRNDGFAANYLVELYADSTLVASASGA